jgi:dethiobiotin synthetase
MTRRIVVVGTGTGVGKTWLSCALLRYLRVRGHTALGLKPIESGVTVAAETDAAALATAGTPPTEVSFSGATATQPYRLVDPISPHLAARRAGMTVELDVALRYVREQESLIATRASPLTLIESAGGLFSPLGEGVTNFELACALEPAAWLLVAPDSLGVLHDLTATLIAARSRGRVPDAIALCRARPADASTGTNADEIAGLGIGPRPRVFASEDAAELGALADDLLR